jgi:uncharacterized alkaline shock family protein YloU
MRWIHGRLISRKSVWSDQTSGRSCRTNVLSNAIEVQSSDVNYKFKIHVSLMNGINIKEVLEEIQNRVNDSLSKLAGLDSAFIIDVVVDELVVL